MANRKHDKSELFTEDPTRPFGIPVAKLRYRLVSGTTILAYANDRKELEDLKDALGDEALTIVEQRKS